MRRMMPAVAMAIALAACYQTPQPACLFLCGDGDACPDGYECGADDNRCHFVEAGGELADCPDDLPIEPDASIDAEPDPDAFPTCAAALAPADDGSGVARQALQIAEVNPGEYIELFNNAAVDTPLAGVGYYLVSEPQSVALSVAGAGVTVPALGRATIPWPAAFTDVDAGGEVVLYVDNVAFTDGTKIMSFVCWGTNPHASRKTEAETGAKWTAAALCPGALTMGAIHRLMATDGRDPIDFDVSGAPSPQTCAP